MRHMTKRDHWLSAADNAIKTLSHVAPTTARPNPAETLDTHSDNPALSAQLMRINHTGEICAQALYSGQALTARDPDIADRLSRASLEEQDHLSWCQHRLEDLNSRSSFLNPLWYFGSFTIGAIAGVAGDKWSLGFLAETERQVVEHLSDQLEKLPRSDTASRAIVLQMREDEAEHAQLATDLGAYELPFFIRKTMHGLAALMKKTVKWI